MVDLRSSYGGREIKNPLICGAGPPTHTPEACKRASDAGFAGVVLKTHAAKEAPYTLTHTVGTPTYILTNLRGTELWRPIPPKKSLPKIRGIKGERNPEYSMVGVHAGVILSYFLGEDYVKYANKTKDLVKDDCLVIGSIVAYNEEGWIEQCNLINRTNVDLVELNYGCPCALPEEECYPGVIPGAALGASPLAVEAFTKIAVKNLRVPAIVKLPPQQANSLLTAKAAVRGGAVGINCGDSSFFPSVHIDIETATPGWHPRYPAWHGIWGPWVLPYVCGQIANMRLNNISIDISASGGTARFEDIVRFFMAGSSSVQPCRELMVQGWDAAAGWLEDLATWMGKKGYDSVMEMKGIAADKIITDYSKLDLPVPQILGGPEPKYKMIVDRGKCIDCGWCETCCSHLAIKIENELPHWKTKKCELCGLCEAICPTRAISMVSK